MHHGKDRESEIVRQLREHLEQQARERDLGATGDFPEGQLTPDDEGAVRLGVGVHEGKVILNFGTPVVWCGFSPKQARQLAESLRQASYRAEKQ